MNEFNLRETPLSYEKWKLLKNDEMLQKINFTKTNYRSSSFFLSSSNILMSETKTVTGFSEFMTLAQ